jgi:hypothetical protein
MITLTKTVTMTSLALILAVLLGMWLATTSPANSSGESMAPSMAVETRLGAAELDLCAGQAWPHFSAGCAAWIAASSNHDGVDRSISGLVHDVDHGFTIAGKASLTEMAAR